ncbi:hypothetical protein Aph02nite_17160 [Actinoplanes philippinensis]|uniref:Uncharacterized protein n=1 Tax=Actinoplanes philippinensis TaxID=35752 RepID=A0A1I2BBV3_9ACTN|nr:hypothetical protein [Actinoplanes philippinensis]GIE75766.1 hypothetical protein Aph02nite_17160 [Actinoplanes philippinensis]SFE52620.1 hypothetical protein SAMN05421541_102180 [Actinoplanes philippinensis]
MKPLGNRGPVVETVSPPAPNPAVLLSRIAEVDRLTAVNLLAQSDLYADDRNGELVDLLLDIRRALCLPAAGVSVPIVPGRSS